MRNEPITLFNPSIVASLYDKRKSNNDLYDRMVFVLRYYREGHAHYTQQVKAISEDEFNNSIELLESLKSLVEDMMTNDQTTGLIYRRAEDKLELYVDPIYKYLQKHSITELKNKIRLIKGRIHDYIHADNFTMVANSYKCMDRWELFFDEVKKNQELK